MSETKTEKNKQEKTENPLPDPASRKAVSQPRPAAQTKKALAKSEYVYLTRCVKDPVTETVYPVGKYLRSETPAIAFEKGFAIAKSN